jgi:hypothetical protein
VVSVGARVDALANPSVQRWLLVALAIAGGVGALVFLGVLWTARRPISAPARVFRRRAGAVGLFVAVAAGAGYAVLSTPVDNGTTARPPVAAGAGPGGEGEGGVEVATERQFSSRKLPALSVDAPDGWKLEVDQTGRKLTAAGGTARLLVSSAILTEAVEVEAMLRQLAETQRSLGFEVSATFTDRIGDLPAAGFVAAGPTRSICTFMVKRDLRLATSLICTSEGKVSARDACRPVLAKIRWRAPGP